MTFSKTFTMLAFGLGLSACTGLGVLSDGSRLSVGDACVIDDDCGAGLECDDAVCKEHGGDDDDGADDDGGSGVACTADSDCAAGEECDDGFCKLHGGDDPADDAGDDDGADDDGADDDDHGGESGPG